MDPVQQTLPGFEPVTLDEMDSVKLMDRADTKYIFSRDLLPGVLQSLTPFYRVLDINGRRISNYHTLYFDSPGFTFYLKHQNGKLNRHKVRYRKYLETEKCFFEIKFKNNKGKTIKERIKQKAVSTVIEGKAEEFLKKSIPENRGILEPKLNVFYSRITLVSNVRMERVTLDINLRYQAVDTEKPERVLEKNIGNFVIAEVKQQKFSATSHFFQTMKQFHIHTSPFSKYCVGSFLLYNDLKYNRFKPQLLTLQKITHVRIF